MLNQKYRKFGHRASLGYLGQSLAKPSDAEINAYVRENLQRPDLIESAMKSYGVNLSDIKRATGYTVTEMKDYIQQSGNAFLNQILAIWLSGSNPTPTPTAQVQTQAVERVTDAQINQFVRDNLNSPQSIADAMQQYRVTLADIQRATQFTTAEIRDYIAKSGVEYLYAMFQGLTGENIRPGQTVSAQGQAPGQTVSAQPIKAVETQNTKPAGADSPFYATVYPSGGSSSPTVLYPGSGTPFNKPMAVQTISDALNAQSESEKSSLSVGVLLSAGALLLSLMDK